MHIGPYATEPETVEKMRRFAVSYGIKMSPAPDPSRPSSQIGLEGSR
jgi:hypothetical protein